MAAYSFDEFYQAANGYPPFPWQARLAARVLEGEWPSIDVPTGCGKSSVVDVAVYALAVGAELAAVRGLHGGPDRIAPFVSRVRRKPFEPSDPGGTGRQRFATDCGRSTPFAAITANLGIGAPVSGRRLAR